MKKATKTTKTAKATKATKTTKTAKATKTTKTESIGTRFTNRTIGDDLRRVIVCNVTEDVEFTYFSRTECYFELDRGSIAVRCHLMNDYDGGRCVFAIATYWKGAAFKSIDISARGTRSLTDGINRIIPKIREDIAA